MPVTYTPIATQTLGSATSSVTFSSIPSTYTDLRLVISMGGSVVDYFLKMQFNSDTSTNYSLTELKGNGSAASSARSTDVSSIYVPKDLGYGTTVGNNMFTIDVQNYSNSTTFKTTLIRANCTDPTATALGTSAIVGLWRSTSAISSIVFSTLTGTILAGSTFTLYGIKAA